jgi:hypothetical protein
MLGILDAGTLTRNLLDGALGYRVIVAGKIERLAKLGVITKLLAFTVPEAVETL